MSLHGWVKAHAEAWVCANIQDWDKALEWYRVADLEAATDPELRATVLNPELSLLRHRAGEAKGIVRAMPPTEDAIHGLEFHRDIEEEGSSAGMKEPSTVVSSITIQQAIESPNDMVPDYHQKNIKADLPHLQVISAGRSGTVSLWRLFDRCNYLPYHQCVVNIPQLDYQERACGWSMGGEKPYLNTDAYWVMTRAAEWIGAINIERPMALLGHRDTVYAPVFAGMHPLSKFIYLHRDPKAIFRSMYSKQQWGSNQNRPAYFEFDPTFRFRFARPDVPAEIAWYLRFSENFCRAFINLMEEQGRGIVISAEKLFAQDEEELHRLIKFAGIDLQFDAVKKHFETPYNQKLHKINVTPDSLALAEAEFDRVWRTA